MFAVFVNVRIEPARHAEAITDLHEEVVPRIKSAPGLVRGTWFGYQERGHGLMVFESEDQARQAASISRFIAWRSGAIRGHTYVRSQRRGLSVGFWPAYVDKAAVGPFASAEPHHQLCEYHAGQRWWTARSVEHEHLRQGAASQVRVVGRKRLDLLIDAQQRRGTARRCSCAAAEVIKGPAAHLLANPVFLMGHLCTTAATSRESRPRMATTSSQRLRPRRWASTARTW